MVEFEFRCRLKTIAGWSVVVVKYSPRCGLWPAGLVSGGALC